MTKDKKGESGKSSAKATSPTGAKKATRVPDPALEPMQVTDELTRHLYGLVLHAIQSGSVMQNFDLKDIKNEMGFFVGDWRVTVERTR